MGTPGCIGSQLDPSQPCFAHADEDARAAKLKQLDDDGLLDFVQGVEFTEQLLTELLAAAPIKDGRSVLRGADFRSARFQGSAMFCQVSFLGDAVFDRVTFQGDAKFTAASFQSNAQFDRVSFYGDAVFDGVSFAVTIQVHAGIGSQGLLSNRGQSTPSTLSPCLRAVEM
jgi:uncharacterized protein YjbI with pentapeptide repeats